MLAVVAPVFQRKAVAELVAVSVSGVTAHVNVPLPGFRLRVGVTVLLLIVVVALIVQPLVPVAVTEYGPATLTLILAVVAE